MKSSEVNNGESEMKREHKKPLFRPAKDDTKPLLQDPILRSDPIVTEEAVLRLPPLPDCIKVKSQPPLNL
ncbi:uncharacterized protein LOC111405751 [Olea europaea var. sylvestris]|uniref:uncharacterized protein LOC111405751 n=1 Tax=Olea europaea var. sylvestris TaxID=158386 RepID=UPI000C1D1881|nr:uncharacterized protein LOC111405751 [Olea europaea var. sylvestris]